MGHPIGASGNRIVVTLLYELLRNKMKKIGLATLCIGSGMGLSNIKENIIYARKFKNKRYYKYRY